MTGKTVQSAAIWVLVRRQHGVITRGQLLARGVTRHGIAHRLAEGRLHRVHAGVYAVGRPELTQHGRWMAAVLACGPGAALSHTSAAALWGIRPEHAGAIHISVPDGRRPKHPGIRTHRRAQLDATAKDGIPLTSPIATLIDLAEQLSDD